MQNCRFCGQDGANLRSGQRPEARLAAAQHLIDRRHKLCDELKKKLQEPVSACQAPASASTMLPFRTNTKEGTKKDDERFAVGAATIRDPWVKDVRLTDTLENAKMALKAVYDASSWDIPAHPDGTPADANADAIAFQLRYWAGSEFFPVWDPIKDFHLPVWVQDVMNDEFLAKCRGRRFWEMRTISKVANVFPASIPDPQSELGREVSTAEKEGASEIKIDPNHPLRVALKNVEKLPPGLRVGIAMAGRLLSLIKDIRIPNQAEQERQQSDTSSFDKDKPPTQIGFAYSNLPEASVEMFTKITFGLVRTVASALSHHSSLPEAATVQLLDAIDTCMGLLHIYPSFPHCVGTLAAIEDPEVIQAMVEIAHRGAPSASLASLKVLAKLVPDLTKLTRTSLNGPQGIEYGDSSVADETIKVVERNLAPAIGDLVGRAILQDAQYAAGVSAYLAIIFRAAQMEDRLWDVQTAFKSHGNKYTEEDNSFIARFLETPDPTADTALVRKFPILLPPRRTNAMCTCRTNENNPARSPVCHACYPYLYSIGAKYGNRSIYGLRLPNGNHKAAVPVFEAAEAVQIWCDELIDIAGGDPVAVERTFRDCVRALTADEAFRAAPGIPRASREKFERWGTSGEADRLVTDESAIVLGRLLGNTQIRQDVYVGGDK